MLLDQIDALNRQIDTLTTRIEAAIAAIPAAGPTNTDPDQSDHGHPTPPKGLTTIERLDEIPGISPLGAQIILAEVGLDMTRFPTARHLASWPKLTPRPIQSAPQHHPAKPA